MKIIISCLAENTYDFHCKVIRLFVSAAETFAGDPNVGYVALYVEQVDENIKRYLSDLSVDVQVVSPFDSRSPHSNKICMLGLEANYDVMIALDCDIVISRDFRTEISKEAFQAKPVDYDPLAIEQWAGLFNYFGMDMPQRRYRTSCDFEETTAYFNSGVLSIPKQYVKVLKDAWGYYARELLVHTPNIQGIGEHRFYTDQFALALALAASGIPVLPFGIEMNFPTHVPIHGEWLPHLANPYIFHYHTRLHDNGLLQETGFLMPDQGIYKMNRILKKQRGVPKV